MPPEPPVQIRINRNLVDQPPEEPESTETAGTNPIREPLAVLLLLLLSLCAVNLLKPDGDPDVWARLAVGKLIVESGAVPDQDPFAYTPRRPQWIDHEWGAGVVFYLVASMGGQVGLLVLKALLLFGTMLFIYLRCRRATGRPPSLFFHLLVLAALYFGFLASIRAQAFTFFFFSAWLYLLERARDGNWRGIWLIPVSGVFWANLHGGFLAGVGLIVLFAASEFIRKGPAGRFSLLAATTAAGSLVNPYGLSYWSYLFDATMMSRSTIAEWRPLNFFAADGVFLGFKVLFVLTAIGLLARLYQRTLPDPATLLALAVTAGLGFRVVRHITFFVIVSAPFVWAWLWSVWTSRLKPVLAKSGRQVTPLIESAYYGLSRGLVLVMTVNLLSAVPMRIVLFESFPVRAIDFIAQNGLKGNLLVPFNFGSYAIWRLYPDCRVSMDGRYETVYLDATFRSVREFFGGLPGSETLLDTQTHDIILAPRNEAAEKMMSRRADWAIAYEDARHRVYVPTVKQREWQGPGEPRKVDPFSTADKPSFVRPSSPTP